jgi:hypothetical protein
MAIASYQARITDEQIEDGRCQRKAELRRSPPALARQDGGARFPGDGVTNRSTRVTQGLGRPLL